MSSADENPLQVAFVFEACARLGRGAELASLAAHLYHRFYKTITNEIASYCDLFTFGLAAVKLAHRFYEEHVDNADMVLVLASITNHLDCLADDRRCRELKQTIDVVTRLMAINLNFQIDYGEIRKFTPGELVRARRSQEVVTVELSDSDDDLSYTNDQIVEDKYLSHNSKSLVSAHRYLVHYLKAIQMFVSEAAMSHFHLFTNIAWTLITDIYWSPSVMNLHRPHLACACLMLAKEVCRSDFNSRNKDKLELWKLLDKRWNLIFCDDLSEAQLAQIEVTIVRQYREYERLHEHEFSTYVIDPARAGQLSSRQH